MCLTDFFFPPLDLDYGHLIPYFGFIHFHVENSSAPGDPVGVFRPFQHLRDKIVFIKNQPVVYKEGARKVKVFFIFLEQFERNNEILTPNVHSSVL